MDQDATAKDDPQKLLIPVELKLKSSLQENRWAVFASLLRKTTPGRLRRTCHGLPGSLRICPPRPPLPGLRARQGHSTYMSATCRRLAAFIIISLRSATAEQPRSTAGSCTPAFTPGHKIVEGASPDRA